ncbi:MAG: AMP-binding protein [Burkholderiales bacterium]
MDREATPHADETDAKARVLLGVVRETCRDLHRERVHPDDVSLDGSLERDLGLDSLARVELLIRVERAFGVRLPEDTIARADTPRDLLAAVAAAPRDVSRGTLAKERAAPVERLRAEPAEAGTLQEVLEWHAGRHPERRQVTVVSPDGEQEISYGELMAEASAVAARLQDAGVEAGQAVAIMLPTGADYFHAFFGILLAGAIPVPIYPPAQMSRIEDHVRRHAGILANAEAVAMLTVAEAMPVARLLEAIVPGLRHVLALGGPEGARRVFTPAAASPGDIAFIQYTSGSTGNPKGVVLTHANLLANIRAIGKGARVAPEDVFVSWLPLYHDFGLIATFLASLYYGNPFVVLSPLTFLARPESWLWAIHRHGGTLTAAPNFAYELCVKRIRDEQVEGVDLSTLRIAANGAEPVSPDTMERFIARFARHGFRREAMMPVFGLAEATVGLLIPPLGRGPRVDRIRRDTFVRERRAVPAAPDDKDAMRFVACGKPLPGHRIRIVDEAGGELGEREEGRLEFQGPSATRGYYRNPEETARLFDGDWLVTGDRAYLAEGEVCITGRVKDIVIRAGRNIYPHEIEEAVGAVPGVRKGCVAAFGSPDPQTGTERLVVLAETREKEAVAREKLRDAVTRAVSEVLGEPPDEVVLAPPHTVPKTSSGKIRRAASREVFESGLVGAPTHAVWMQFARLAMSALAAKAAAWLAIARRAFYAGWTWAVFWTLAPPAWLAIAATRRPATAWRMGRAAARTFLALIGIRLVVKGALPRGEPFVVVANHASYLDGLVLVAALEDPCRFVAKRELLDHVVSRVFLTRLGADFVERFSAAKSVEDAARLAADAVQGAPLAIFPEGTFRRAPGLLEFRLGAFAAAAQARIPVVPVAIAGTRAVLPAGTWAPRRHAVTVTCGEPIAVPAGVEDAFAASVAMRNAAREAILREMGEVDAGHVA